MKHSTIVIGALVGGLFFGAIGASSLQISQTAQSTDTNKDKSTTPSVSIQPVNDLLSPDPLLLLASGNFLELKTAVLDAESMSKGDLFGYISNIQTRDFEKKSILDAYIFRLLSIDAELAFAALRGNNEIPRLWLIYLKSWANEDFPAASNYFISLTSEDEKQSAAQVLFSLPGIEETDLMPALIAALGDQAQAMMIQKKINTLSAKQAFEEVFELEENGNSDQHSLLTATQRWLKEDPAAVIERLAMMPNGETRRKLISHIAMIPSDTLAGLPIIDLISRSLPHDKSILSKAIINTSKTDPLSVLGLAENSVREGGALNTLSRVMSNWAAIDLNASLAYIDGQPAAKKDQLYTAISRAYIKQSPREALLWSLSLDGKLSTTKKMTIRNLAISHPDLLSSMMTTLSSAKDRKAVSDIVWTNRSYANPASTVNDYLLQNGNTSSDKMFTRLLGNWHNSKPVEASNYISQLILENPDLIVTSSGIENWYAADSDAAAAWLESLPQNSQPRTFNTGRLVTAMSKTSPRSAMKHLATMPPGKTRISAANKLAHNWLSQEPDSLPEIVQTMGLSDKEAAHMRTHLDTK